MVIGTKGEVQRPTLSLSVEMGVGHDCSMLRMLFMLSHSYFTEEVSIGRLWKVQSLP